MKAYREKEFTSQMISPPIILSLTMQEEVLLKKFLPEFEKLGYEIEHFGGKEYAVNAVPGNLYGLNGQSLLLELMDGLGNMSEKDTPDLVVEKIASMSCKAAVKGNQKLSRPEIEHLIDELLANGHRGFTVDYLPKDLSVESYQAVVTSGLGGWMPPGILVGTVVPDSNGRLLEYPEAARASVKCLPVAEFGAFHFLSIIVPDND